MKTYTKEEGKKLIILARKAIEEEFNGEKIFESEIQEYKEKSGVFVTLHTIDGKLRGCVGFPNAIFSLGEATVQAAKSAAFYDFRFISLVREELKDVKIEISILSILEECSIYGIELGKDGLICEYEGCSGLLLPQVAVENNFSEKEFLECLCEKAGLDKEAYKKEGFKLQKFSCQIFKE